MKVILLQDVARIGKRFEVKEVPDGHALNFLIPRKMAEPATAENLKRIAARTQKIAAGKSGTLALFSTLLAALKGQVVEMAVTANEQGHLFKGVKAEDIAQHVSALHGKLSAAQVLLEAPLKDLGEHEIALAEGAERGSFTLKLVAK